MNVNDIHLAALLHDIGKFAQRAIDPRRAHQEFSAEFVSELGLGTEVQDLVLNHHNPKNSRFEEEYEDHTSSINPEKYSSKARSMLSLDSKKPISLKKAYQLLAYEGYEIGKKFINDERLKNLLRLRNHSILAHGLQTVKKEEYEEFYEKVVSYAEIIDENIKSKIEDASFPKLTKNN